MGKSTFKRDTLGLTGGFIIPPFIIADDNLDLEDKYNLSGFLQKHLILGNEFKVPVFKCDCCNRHEFFREMVIRLEELFYITVNSTDEFDDHLVFTIQINPLYLKYIKRNPYYGVYRIDYFQFLLNDILPEIEDEDLREELINTILDNSIDDDSDFDDDEQVGGN